MYKAFVLRKLRSVFAGPVFSKGSHGLELRDPHLAGLCCLDVEESQAPSFATEVRQCSGLCFHADFLMTCSLMRNSVSRCRLTLRRKWDEISE